MDEDTPLWKRALMKKRDAEKNKKDQELSKKVNYFEMLC